MSENKLVIVTGYKCNNNCLFCYDSNKRNIKDKTTTEIVNDLLAGRKNNCTYVDFIGGEPTIRKDLFFIVNKTKELGYRNICITTNGRMLCYNEFLKKLVDKGLNSIIFSIHGHNSRLHDSQTRVKGSFEQLMKGLKNVQALAKQRKIQIGSNTTITKYNYKHLPKIGKFLVKNGIKNSEFIFVDPTGSAYNNFNSVVPRISEVSKYVKQLLDIGIKNNIPHWHVRYLPFCYLEGYEGNISEKGSPFKKEIHFAPEFKNYDVEGSRKIIARIKAKSCSQCKFGSFCEGIWKEYAKRYGLEELKPIRK
jgi:cyclic pyranopterin phosphate synthase